MVEKIQTLLVLLGIIGVLAVVAERVKFPFPILLHSMWKVKARSLTLTLT